MSELRRWLDDAPPSEVRRLLEVGQWARPSRAVLEQALSQVQTAGAIGAADAGPSRHGSRSRTAVKWTLIGALLVGSIAALNSTLGSGQSASAPVEPPSNEPAPLVVAAPHTPAGQTAPDPARNDEPTQARPNSSPPAPGAAVAAAPVRPEPEPRPTARVPSSAASPRTASASDSRARERVCKPGVVEQIELLEQAKNKIAQRRAGEALAILERYDGFGAGRCFVPESLKHRMDAYVQIGNQAAAQRIATAIKKSFPDTAQARAAEAVLRK